MTEVYISIKEETIFGNDKDKNIDIKSFLTELERDLYIENESIIYRNLKFSEYKKNCFDDGMKININFKKKKELVEDLSTINF
jgi:hypothetical protein